MNLGQDNDNAHSGIQQESWFNPPSHEAFSISMLLAPPKKGNANPSRNEKKNTNTGTVTTIAGGENVLRSPRPDSKVVVSPPSKRDAPSPGGVSHLNQEQKSEWPKICPGQFLDPDEVSFLNSSPDRHGKRLSAIDWEGDEVTKHE